jgi:hypothetical protein
MNERSHIGLGYRFGGSAVHQHANAAHALALLRARRERPRGRATERG